MMSGNSSGVSNVPTTTTTTTTTNNNNNHNKQLKKNKNKNKQMNKTKTKSKSKKRLQHSNDNDDDDEEEEAKQSVMNLRRHQEVEAEAEKGKITEVPPPPSTSNSDSDWTDSTIMTDNWTLVKKYAHDPVSFTQGLEVVPFHIASTLFDNYKAEQQKQQQRQQQQQEDEEEEAEDEECSNVEEDENDDQTCNSNTNDNDTPNPPPPLLVVESTGMYGDSLVRIWEPKIGTIIKETSMNKKLFGEGLCFYRDTILLDTDTDTNDATSPPVERDLYVQLTYREQTILIYDAHTLELLKTIQKWPSETTTKEGWGITYNPTERIFYVTDGSDYIHYWNRQFQEIRPKQRVYINELITVDDNQNDDEKYIIWPRKEDSTSYPINYLNELEYDITTNTILANKIFDDIVLRIDPETGLVLTVYNFDSPNGNDKILYPKSLRTNKNVLNENNQNSDQNENDDIELELAVLPEPDVFNGIAIIPNTDGKEWLLTGKYWNSVYYIRIDE
ncbi:hypothetical protein FRACYDRAFT_247383 [Fragilariopsis cylindrus CCMP1102]|uniref:Uncharacterized protein n=1 Tax=Fragilariopsis cylindrus CCMP1102 TaxID=635003 RepID=A0A1E7EWK5_9STRA|nr:hypothetical protein FRACYDRAFT_247383 [Fragilariopsis cylindrus CCMP1102]|eukprot:OEU10351.1 hypothetical protein FRACYDRAFT_247383 [Fragilariopsis cylindrus CCMP1102]